jgi:predicted dehydrogenase
MRRLTGPVLMCLVFLLPHDTRGQNLPAKPLRAGMIGLDTSHVPAFAKQFNSSEAAGDLAAIKIVAGYPGGTDLPASADRVARFTETIKGMGIEIVDSIPALLAKVDVVLRESVDGRILLQEAVPVIKAGKPLWIDKPVAGSLADAIVIYDLAKKHNVPVFSSSPARFGSGLRALLNNDAVGTIQGASTWGSCSYSTGTPDMFFYGIHGIEPLFTLMGTGCETVSRVKTKDTDFVTGVWKDGRVGAYRGIRNASAGSGTVVYGSKSIAQAERGGGGYDGLCQEIGKFFATGKSPVPAEETIEIFAFMEAADESKRQGGSPVKLADVLAKGQAEAAKKLTEL